MGDQFRRAGARFSRALLITAASASLLLYLLDFIETGGSRAALQALLASSIVLLSLWQ
jgi:hypothetical protein